MATTSLNLHALYACYLGIQPFRDSAMSDTMAIAPRCVCSSTCRSPTSAGNCIDHEWADVLCMTGVYMQRQSKVAAGLTSKAAMGGADPTVTMVSLAAV